VISVRVVDLGAREVVDSTGLCVGSSAVSPVFLARAAIAVRAVPVVPGCKVKGFYSRAGCVKALGVGYCASINR
jgi:hypothetical protein